MFNRCCSMCNIELCVVWLRPIVGSRSGHRYVCMCNQALGQPIIIGMNGGSIERIAAAIYFQETDCLSSMHLRQMFTKNTHESFSVRDFVVVTGLHDGLGSICGHPWDSFEHIDVGIKHVDASFRDGGRNGILKRGFKFALRQFALIRS